MVRAGRRLLVAQGEGGIAVGASTVAKILVIPAEREKQFRLRCRSQSAFARVLGAFQPRDRQLPDRECNRRAGRRELKDLWCVPACSRICHYAESYCRILR
jgi:hypothetical protein